VDRADSRLVTCEHGVGSGKLVGFLTRLSTRTPPALAPPHRTRSGGVLVSSRTERGSSFLQGRSARYAAARAAINARASEMSALYPASEQGASTMTVSGIAK
jgi:hypothetical protein